MKWIVEIGKFAVNIQNDCGYKRTYSVKQGWIASADKVDEFMIVKIMNAKDQKATIHLCMLPVDDVSLVWIDIDYIYKRFE
jgi:hypothetical protein